MGQGSGARRVKGLLKFLHGLAVSQGGVWSRVEGSGLGFRVWGLGFGVSGLGFRVWALGFLVRGSGFRVWALV